MPKTKDAFALRDFDEERILQRPYFRELNFAAKTDAEILATLKAAETDSIDMLEEKLQAIKAIYNKLISFQKFIERHCNRCDKYNRRKIKSEGIRITNLKRPAPVLEYIFANTSSIDLSREFQKAYYELEKLIQACYKQELAKRVRKLRKATGLTQAQFGDLVQVSPQGFSLYERGERELPIHTLIRMAKVLNISSDEILGIK